MVLRVLKVFDFFYSTGLCLGWIREDELQYIQVILTQDAGVWKDKKWKEQSLGFNFQFCL